MTSDDLKTLTVWVPGKIVNTLNTRAPWWTDATRAQRQRDTVCAAVLHALGRRRFVVPASRPKVITFHAFTARPYDGDGLQAAVKHIRDGLMDAGVIHGDGPAHGHRFVYEQTAGVPDHQRGVRITIGLG